MKLFNHCTLRRILSDTRIWPSACPFLPRAGRHAVQSLDIPGSANTRREYSTVFTWKATRPVDKRAKLEVINMLLFLLRREIGRNHGFANRDDDYVSVQKLLSHPHFHSMDFTTLQYLINDDIKHRIELKFDPSKAEDCWWIRAKRWNEKHYIMRPASYRDSITAAVYRTTLQEWNDHIARNGIPRGQNEYIEVSRGIPSAGYLGTLQEQQQLLIFLDFQKCLRSGVHFLMPGATAQKSLRATHVLLTRGNEMGYIPPHLFATVEHVTLKKRVLWGEEEEGKAFTWQDWNEDKEDEAAYDEHGRRKTLVEDPGMRIHAFTDRVGLSRDAGLASPSMELIEEARQTLSLPT